MQPEQNLSFSTRIQQFICFVVFILLLAFANPNSRAATIVTLTVTSNSLSPWTCPPGLTTISVAVQGGGGGGGAGQNNNGQGGGGGGGACAFNPNFPVTPGQAYSFVVGSGGPGAGASAGSGTTGGNSTFATLTAGGGGGGTSSSAANQTQAGGAGGSASDSVSEGTVFNLGGAGGGTGSTGAGYGAGGGAAGTAAAGNPGSGVTTGGGGLGGAGQPAGGNGADGPATKGNAGTSGTGPGGGGSGGWRNGSNLSGGAGADGQIVIVYTIPSFTVTYNANGGAQAPVDPNSPYVYGSTITVLGVGTMTNSGQAFNGWNTAANGSGTAFAPGTIISNLQANLTLYAQWLSTPNVLSIETAADGTGTVITNQSLFTRNTVTAYAVVRGPGGGFVTNSTAAWSLINQMGGTAASDLTVAGDGKSAVFTGNRFGTATILAYSMSYGYSQSGVLTVTTRPVSQVTVETAPDGSGGPVASQSLGAGGTVTGYAIGRDVDGFFVTNLPAAWSLVNVTGGVTGADLVVAGDGKSATFTGNQLGSASMQAIAGVLPAAQSGTLTVAGAWTLTDNLGTQAGDKRSWITNQTAAPPDCNVMFCPGGIYSTDIGDRNIGSFWIGETEVTYALWSAVYTWAMTNGYHFQNPGHTSGTASYPVDTVSWRDAVVWCNAISERAGLRPVYVDLNGQVVRDSRDANSNVCDQTVNNSANGANGFRLPSQWEWECAARWQGTNSAGGAANVSGVYWTPGGSPSGSQGESNDYALYSNFGNNMLAVKSRLPNYLGCYDMSGNVGEWCFGTTSADAYLRNWRGGPYYQQSQYQTVSMRLAFFPYSAGLGTGFRVALSQDNLGKDYVVDGGPVSGPVRAPARKLTAGRVGTNFHFEDEKMACLEDPDDFPISRASLGTLKLEAVGEDVYASNDPALGPDMDQINQMLFNLFQSGTEVFGPQPIEPSSDSYGNCGYTPARVTNMIQGFQNQEALGRTVFGGWFFREDAFLSPHWVTNGSNVSIDTNYYGGPLYTPPFPDIDRRILAPGDIQNLRAGLAASSLNCKTNFKIIHLLLAQTMLQLLHPELYTNLSFTPQEGAACLEYLRTNFDGFGEEQHINGLGSKNLQSMGTYSQWALANGKMSFMFLGGGPVSVGWGLDYARKGYESIFSALQAQGVAPNNTNLIWFRQAGFNGEQMLPENIDDDSNAAILTATAWLGKRLSGPLITNTPNLIATNGQLWSWQPVAACFDTNQFVWSLANAPAGMTVDPATGLVQWTPGANDDSSGQVTLTVTNTVGLGGSDSYIFQVVLPTVFDLGAATLTSSNATLNLANQNIGGVPCTIKLVMTGYSPTHNNAPLALGSGATAGGLVVTDGGGNAIGNGEGINFDIQVVGPVTNLNFAVIQFMVAGNSGTGRAYNLTDEPGTTNGFAGNELDSGDGGVKMGTGIPVAVTMDSQPLRAGFDFAWNRISGNGAAIGLESLNILVTGTPIPSNTAPTLGAISDRALLAGQTLSFTNFAADPDVPAQTLTFSLLNAPAGAVVNPSNGVFTWRPALAQAPSTNSMNVVVADNGSPSLSATQNFIVTVNSPMKPVFSRPAMSNGFFTFNVTGDSGPDYIVQGSTNLTDWAAIWTNAASLPPFQFTDPLTNHVGQRFYRVQLGP